uniref:Fructose-bisphosphatase n=2 Tax=Eutreptiella TaxID=73024 RepID=A0A7S4LF89_9EUGL
MGSLSEVPRFYHTYTGPSKEPVASQMGKICLAVAACALALVAGTSGTHTSLWTSTATTRAPTMATPAGLSAVAGSIRPTGHTAAAAPQPAPFVGPASGPHRSPATPFSTASAPSAAQWAWVAGLACWSAALAAAALWGRRQPQVAMMAYAGEKAAGYGASHTSFYTSATAKDSYATLDEILNAKMADEGVRVVTRQVLDACVKITEALRVNLVTVADAQNSVFGDVQLGVDVIADDLMWGMARSSSLVREAASEEEPVMVETNPYGRFTICWDPLDGSSIVDNNWAVGTIVGVWDKSTGMLGATGRDQVTSIVVLYGPRTTALVACDDGVYEFTCGEGNKWFASREKIQIKQESKVFSPANLRACQEDQGYANLVNYWKQNKYTLRYTGGLVPDVYQCFTKEMGVFSNPTSKASPAKLRVAFEVAPFALLVEKAGGKTSDAVTGGSCLDIRINGVDQRTAGCFGSANEVDRFNQMVLGGSAGSAPSYAGASETDEQRRARLIRANQQYAASLGAAPAPAPTPAPAAPQAGGVESDEQRRARLIQANQQYAASLGAAPAPAPAAAPAPSYAAAAESDEERRARLIQANQQYAASLGAAPAPAPAAAAAPSYAGAAESDEERRARLIRQQQEYARSLGH